MSKKIRFKYKICFQTKSKVWMYKNSRLRNFYRIRAKRILFWGKYGRKFLITKNMKWTVIRRHFVPYFRNKMRFRYSYKNLFFNKQQLKKIYGELQEYEIRNILKQNMRLINFYKRNVLVGAFERRLNMVFFRMRLLPTILACTQFILHKGILVDNKLITVPSYKINIGNNISIPDNYWMIFYELIYYRLLVRFFGEYILLRRKFLIASKVRYLILKKNKKIIKQNWKIFYDFIKYKNKFLKFNKIIRKLYKKYKKFKNNSFLKIIIFFKKYFKKYILKIFNKLDKLFNNKSFNKNYGYRTKKIYYLLNMFFIFYRFLFFKQILIKFFFYIKFLNLNLLLNNLLIKNFEKKKIINIIKRYNYILNKLNLLKKLKFEKNKFLIEKNLHKKWFYIYKKSLIFSNKLNIKYWRKLLFRIRKIKYIKKKSKKFKNWCNEIHWFIPKYYEFDFFTLRLTMLYYPDYNEVFFGFPCSLKKIVSFYKQKAL